MILDEAIKHCKDIAKDKQCTKCGEEHQQLAEWLEELKELKKMLSEISDSDIKHAIIAELASSKSLYEEKFHSMHEAESVIREEAWELESEVDEIKSIVESPCDGGLFGSVYNNNQIAFEGACEYIESRAIEAAKEAVQLAAMAKKALEGFRDEKDE